MLEYSVKGIELIGAKYDSLELKPYQILDELSNKVMFMFYDSMDCVHRTEELTREFLTNLKENHGISKSYAMGSFNGDYKEMLKIPSSFIEDYIASDI